MTRVVWTVSSQHALHMVFSMYVCSNPKSALGGVIAPVQGSGSNAPCVKMSKCDSGGVMLSGGVSFVKKSNCRAGGGLSEKHGHWGSSESLRWTLRSQIQVQKYYLAPTHFVSGQSVLEIITCDAQNWQCLKYIKQSCFWRRFPQIWLIIFKSHVILNWSSHDFSFENALTISIA